MADRIKLVKPKLPGGFQDFSPRRMLARQRIVRAIEAVYRRFGCVPLQTSIAQRRSVLTGNQPVENRLWDARVDKTRILLSDPNQVTLRYDLTVPLARSVAEHIGKLVFPFRRYEVGDVFRGETPQAGRYCEFMQFDADIVGAPTGPADAEIICLIYEVMRAIGIERFLIRINNRKALDGFAERVGCAKGSPEAAALLRVFDKIDDLKLEGVIARLAAAEAPEGERVFGFDEDKLTLVREFMALCDGATNNDERTARLEAYFAGVGIGAEGVAELELVMPLVRAGGVPETHWVIDPSIVRGLGYYTGTVFETILLDKPDFGSMFSGGRFDDLIRRFIGQSLPAVGASVGVDRLFAALVVLGVIKDEDEDEDEDVEPDVDVFVIDMDATLRPDYFAMAAELRKADVSVEIGMPYQDASTRAQMAIALDRRAPVIVFYGPNDKSAGTVGVKTVVKKGKPRQPQQNVPRAELVRAVLTILGR